MTDIVIDLETLGTRPGCPIIEIGACAAGVRVWGNGPTFDLSILAEGYWCLGFPCPWQYAAERCVRTALEMACYERGSVPRIERGPRHRALNDARHEARKLFYAGALGEVSAIMRRLKQRGTLKGVEA